MSDAVATLAAEGTLRRYPRGSLLFAEGDPAGPVFLVVDGAVTLHIGDAAAPIGTVRAGELIGELSAIDHLPRSASALAATDVEVRAVSAARFAELLDADGRLALHVARAIASKLRGSTESRTVHVGGLPATALARAIARRAARGDSPQQPASEYVHELGTSHELLSRAIDYLVACGAITLDRGSIFVLDEQQLQAVAERPSS